MLTFVGGLFNESERNRRGIFQNDPDPYDWYSHNCGSPTDIIIIMMEMLVWLLMKYTVVFIDLII